MSEQKGGKMNDLISRQAALDMIDAIFPVDPTKSEYAQGIACGAALAKTYIKQLPSAQPEVLAHGEGELSAQPEITRCNECAKRRTLDCPMGITVFDAPPSDGYCYKAERRNDG